MMEQPGTQFYGVALTGTMAALRDQTGFDADHKVLELVNHRSLSLVSNRLSYLSVFFNS